MIHSTEKDITKAQKWLKRLGSSVTVNGQMTIGLSRAIYAFQKKNKIPATGELDETTWNLLKQRNSLISRLKRRFVKARTNQNGNK